MAILNAGEILFIGTPAEAKRFSDPLVQQFIHAEFKSNKAAL
jgi:ABC-type transporter Mla maintaining outer membrane lipid asymmetry ATPase subunit MlaF